MRWGRSLRRSPDLAAAIAASNAAFGIATAVRPPTLPCSETTIAAKMGVTRLTPSLAMSLSERRRAPRYGRWLTLLVG
jgi:hypothetical protein